MKKRREICVLFFALVFLAGVIYGLLNYFGAGKRQKEEPFFGETTVIEKESFDEFAWEVAELVKEYDGEKNTEDDLSDPYYSKRLIVQGMGKEQDLTLYEAVACRLEIYIGDDISNQSPVLCQDDIETAATKEVETLSGEKEYTVVVTFNENGKQILKDITSQNIGECMAIVYDGSIISTPVICSPCENGEAEILGLESYEEAEHLASILQSDVSMTTATNNERDSASASLYLDPTSYGAKVVIHGPDDLYVMQFTTKEATKSACDELQEAENVEYCEPDQYAEASDNETYKAMSWGVEQIGADAYAKQVKAATNAAVVVAVVDSGVYEHPFLKERIIDGGCDYVDNDFKPDDKNSHGTHVAGTIVDCTQGLNVMILPVRVLGANGKGSNLIVSLGIRYAVSRGAQVINLSLGTDEGTSRTIDDAVRYAVNRGCIVVAAAGNDSQDTANTSPAHLDECIVVSALNEALDKADFSNYGSSIDFAAPGVNIASCAPRFLWRATIGGTTLVKHGTSMAAPHISALAAMIKLKNPDMTSYEIQKIMRENCVDLGETGWDPYYGWGMPDLSNEEEEPTSETNSEVLEQKQTEESEQIDPLEGYREVLEEYRMLAENQFSRSSWEQAKYANEGVMNFSLQGFCYNIYYRLADLAGDGEPELLISINEKEKPVRIVDIFGMQNGKPLALIESNESVGYRSTYYITTDMRIKNKGSGGALNTEVRYYRLAAGSAIPELEDEYVYDGWEGDHYTHTDASGLSESISEDEYMYVSSDQDADFGGDWILLYDGQTHQSQAISEAEKEEGDNQDSKEIPIHIITDHDSTSATAYQGIFMNGDTFIALPLSTYYESGEPIGIAYRVTRPYRKENGYVFADILETLGEIYDADVGYEIRNAGESYGLTYQLKTVRLEDHPIYNGTYTQVSNSGANMDPSDVWLSIPEESGNAKDGETLPIQFYNEGIEASAYILPDSSSAAITRDQLAGLSLEDLRIARNEIYARHGRMFKASELQQYFEAKLWYVPRYSPEEFEKIQYDVLSDIEWENIKLILKVEEEKKL